MGRPRKDRSELADFYERKCREGKKWGAIVEAVRSKFGIGEDGLKRALRQRVTVNVIEGLKQRLEARTQERAEARRRRLQKPLDE